MSEKPDQHPAPADDVGQAEVQKNMDKETEQGFRGVGVDPTDDHAYTLAGVAAHEPTPETDAETKKKADEAVAKIGVEEKKS